MSGVGDAGRKLTKREEKAIADLEALAKRWPGSLTLFSWSGSLVVFKTDEWQGRNGAASEWRDANEYIVASVGGIPNDGGDP